MTIAGDSSREEKPNSPVVGHYQPCVERQHYLPTGPPEITTQDRQNHAQINEKQNLTSMTEKMIQ